jgi:hypothetical protein
LVLAIYGKARPLDACSPAAKSLTVTAPTNLTFSVTPMQPATHQLSLQWRTNGAAIVGATNPALNLWWAQLGNGTNQVEIDAWDATGLVRTDARNVLHQTNVWTVKLAVPVMQLDSLRWLTNGSFSCQVTGSAPAGVVVEMSTNLVSWTAVQTGALSGGKFIFTNSGAAAAPQRFYRAATPP